MLNKSFWSKNRILLIIAKVSGKAESFLPCYLIQLYQ